MAVHAFDIDGALTKPHVREEYMELFNEGHIVGIVSARPEWKIEQFVENHNLKGDFARSARLTKGIELKKLQQEHPNTDYTYHGSWMRDRLHAKVAGWTYRHA